MAKHMHASGRSSASMSRASSPDQVSQVSADKYLCFARFSTALLALFPLNNDKRMIVFIVQFNAYGCGCIARGSFVL